MRDPSAFGEGDGGADEAWVADPSALIDADEDEHEDEHRLTIGEGEEPDERVDGGNGDSNAMLDFADGDAALAGQRPPGDDALGGFELLSPTTFFGARSMDVDAMIAEAEAGLSGGQSAPSPRSSGADLCAPRAAGAAEHDARASWQPEATSDARDVGDEAVASQFGDAEWALGSIHESSQQTDHSSDTSSSEADTGVGTDAEASQPLVHAEASAWDGAGDTQPHSAQRASFRARRAACSPTIAERGSSEAVAPLPARSASHNGAMTSPRARAPADSNADAPTPTRLLAHGPDADVAAMLSAVPLLSAAAFSGGTPVRTWPARSDAAAGALPGPEAGTGDVEAVELPVSHRAPRAARPFAACGAHAEAAPAPPTLRAAADARPSRGCDAGEARGPSSAAPRLREASVAQATFARAAALASAAAALGSTGTRRLATEAVGDLLQLPALAELAHALLLEPEGLATVPCADGRAAPRGGLQPMGAAGARGADVLQRAAGGGEGGVVERELALRNRTDGAVHVRLAILPPRGPGGGPGGLRLGAGEDAMADGGDTPARVEAESGARAQSSGSTWVVSVDPVAAVVPAGGWLRLRLRWSAVPPVDGAADSVTRDCAADLSTRAAFAEAPSRCGVGAAIARSERAASYDRALHDGGLEAAAAGEPGACNGASATGRRGALWRLRVTAERAPGDALRQAAGDRPAHPTALPAAAHLDLPILVAPPSRELRAAPTTPPARARPRAHAKPRPAQPERVPVRPRAPLLFDLGECRPGCRVRRALRVSAGGSMADSMADSECWAALSAPRRARDTARGDDGGSAASAASGVAFALACGQRAGSVRAANDAPLVRAARCVQRARLRGAASARADPTLTVVATVGLDAAPGETWEAMLTLTRTALAPVRGGGCVALGAASWLEGVLDERRDRAPAGGAGEWAAIDKATMSVAASCASASGATAVVRVLLRAHVADAPPGTAAAPLSACARALSGARGAEHARICAAAARTAVGGVAPSPLALAASPRAHAPAAAPPGAVRAAVVSQSDGSDGARARTAIARGQASAALVRPHPRIMLAAGSVHVQLVRLLPPAPPDVGAERTFETQAAACAQVTLANGGMRPVVCALRVRVAYDTAAGPPTRLRAGAELAVRSADDADVGLYARAPADRADGAAAAAQLVHVSPIAMRLAPGEVARVTLRLAPPARSATRSPELPVRDAGASGGSFGVETADRRAIRAHLLVRAREEDARDVAVDVPAAWDGDGGVELCATLVDALLIDARCAVHTSVAPSAASAGHGDRSPAGMGRAIGAPLLGGEAEAAHSAARMRAAGGRLWEQAPSVRADAARGARMAGASRLELLPAGPRALGAAEAEDRIAGAVRAATCAWRQANFWATVAPAAGTTAVAS
ncbi:hypothetical protein KFE25_007663 [Diacronema lutheri]|uniref:Uncharacterized protein n=1 Tax=Diacronema lutheri TaxID=2081491 RepID=A0A8J6CGI3_DIALT|nr:hypothetical protein KFE25_007663 [Diacronema lutheri]